MFPIWAFGIPYQDPHSRRAHCQTLYPPIEEKTKYCARGCPSMMLAGQLDAAICECKGKCALKTNTRSHQMLCSIHLWWMYLPHKSAAQTKCPLCLIQVYMRGCVSNTAWWTSKPQAHIYMQYFIAFGICFLPNVFVLSNNFIKTPFLCLRDFVAVVLAPPSTSTTFPEKWNVGLYLSDIDSVFVTTNTLCEPAKNAHFLTTATVRRYRFHYCHRRSLGISLLKSHSPYPDLWRKERSSVNLEGFV